MALLLFVMVGAGSVWRGRGSARRGPRRRRSRSCRSATCRAAIPYFAEGIGEEILGQLVARAAVPGRGPGLVRRVRKRCRRARGRAPAGRRLCRRRQRPAGRRPGAGQRRSGARERRIRGCGRTATTASSTTFSRSSSGSAGPSPERCAANWSGLPRLSGPLVTNGEAYNLYLTARGLIRTRNTRRLRHRVQFAARRDQARSELCSGLGKPCGIDLSRGLSRRQRRLDRRSAESRRICAPRASAGARPRRRTSRPRRCFCPTALPKRSSHLRRAVELDPNSAENLIGLGPALAAAGEFDARDGRLQARPGARPCVVQDDRAAGDQACRDGAARRSRGDREGRASPTTNPTCTSCSAASPGSSAIFRRRPDIGRSPRGRTRRAGVRGLGMGVADVRMRRRH